MSDYLKDAYKAVYKHPSWESTAKNHEDYFASKLYNNSYVKEAARTTLVRFSQLFQAYYGIREMKAKKVNKKQLADQKAVQDLTEQITGDKVKYSRVLEDALLADKNRSTGAGQIGNARLGVSDFDKVGQEEATYVNKKNIENVINEDGNLREQMTMLYNASFINGGMNPFQIRYGRSFKNMITNMTEQDVLLIRQLGMKAKNSDLEHFTPRLDLARAQSHYDEKGDIFSSPVAHLYNFKNAVDKNNPKQDKQKGWLTRTWGGIKRVENWWSNKRIDRSKNEQLPGLGENYYNQNEMPLSERELAYGLSNQGNLKWKEGFAYSYMKEPVTAEGLLQTAGASGTARRMLSAYKMLGASKNDLMFFRLALIAWMCGSHDHSLYEILKGSHEVGVRGYEDLSEAATMYMTVDPLTTEQIREEFTKDRTFPHEKVYMTMMTELAVERKNKYDELKRQEAEKGRVMPERNLQAFYLSHTDMTEEKMPASQTALNVYTSAAFRNMNFSMRYESLRNLPYFKNIGLKSNDDKMTLKGNEYKLSYGNAYRGSLPHEAEDKDLKKSIKTNIRLSARIAMDNIQRRIERPVNNGEERQGFTGTVYRGEAYEYNRHKPGAEYTTTNFTSTSETFEVAHAYLASTGGRKIPPGHLTGDKIVGIYHLKGSGINIAEETISTGLRQVLVPIGVKFRVTKAIRPVKEDGDECIDLTNEEIEALDNPRNSLRHTKLAYAVDLVEVPDSESIQKRKKLQKTYNKRKKMMRELQGKLDSRTKKKEAENLAQQEMLAEQQKKEEEAKPKKVKTRELKIPVDETLDLVKMMTEKLSSEGGRRMLGQMKETSTFKMGSLELIPENAARFFVIAACRSSKYRVEEVKELEPLDFDNRLDYSKGIVVIGQILKKSYRYLGDEGIKEVIEDAAKSNEEFATHAASQIASLSSSKDSSDNQNGDKAGNAGGSGYGGNVDGKADNINNDGPNKDIDNKSDSIAGGAEKKPDNKKNEIAQAVLEDQGLSVRTIQKGTTQKRKQADYYTKEAKAMASSMVAIFVTNNGRDLFQRFEDRLRKSIRNAAGKPASKQGMRFVCEYLTTAAVKSEETRRLLKGLLQEPYDTSGKRKKLAGYYEKLIKILEDKYKTAGMRQVVIEVGLVNRSD